MPPLVPGEPRYLSNSQIEILLECTWKHKLKYIDDVQEATSDHLIIGSAVHKGVEVYRIAQMENRLGEWTENQRNRAVIDAMNNEFDTLLYNAENGIPKEGSNIQPMFGVNWSNGMSAEMARNLCKMLLQTYFYRTAESDIPGTPKAPLSMIDTPLSIEEEFMVPIPGMPNWSAKGRFDMRTSTAIVDLKTAKQKYSQPEMAKKTQPSLYSFAWLAKAGEFLPEFRYHLLVKPNRNVWSASSRQSPPQDINAYRAVVQRTRREPSEILWFLDYLRRQIHQIEAGMQTQRQSATWCEYCGVASVCKPWLDEGTRRSPEDVLHSLRELVNSRDVNAEETSPLGLKGNDNGFSEQDSPHRQRGTRSRGSAVKER